MADSVPPPRGWFSRPGLTRTPTLVLLVVALAAAITLVAQNTEVVEFRVLLWTLTMSRIVLLSMATGLGFLAGFVVATLVLRQRAVKPS